MIETYLINDMYYNQNHLSREDASFFELYNNGLDIYGIQRLVCI